MSHVKLFYCSIGLKNKEDFIKLFSLDSAVSEQDFITYVIDKSEKQAPKLLAIQMLLKCLLIFDVQSIDKREGYPFYTNEVISNNHVKIYPL
ncbi:hypothetical protein [Wolbachia pipientis]|uniref:hypothetical protein n=1 Tax=Wolbachia pipientis TaxID=955 RepID=UPI0025A44B4E|nr:hypothetical protein [Wolbachia pipientis]MDM8335692.1 hypothetical protein [Wolbachia pipientis]